MRISKNYSSSGKKSLLIIFIIMFIAIFGAMIFGAQHESKAAAKIEESRSEIELVHDENGRIVLTDALLRSDYSVYVKNADTNIKVMNIVMIALLASLVGWFIVTIVGFIGYQPHLGIHPPDGNLHGLQDKLVLNIVLARFLKFLQLFVEPDTNPTLTENAIDE